LTQDYPAEFFEAIYDTPEEGLARHTIWQAKLALDQSRGTPVETDG
jgi:hypothetical protein